MGKKILLYGHFRKAPGPREFKPGTFLPYVIGDMVRVKYKHRKRVRPGNILTNIWHLSVVKRMKEYFRIFKILTRKQNR